MANDFGKPGRAWAEAEYERTDLEAVIQDLLTGQYSNPIRVVAFNTAERWSEEVSVEIAQELRRRCDLQMRDIPFFLQDFTDRYEGQHHDIQLPHALGVAVPFQRKKPAAIGTKAPFPGFVEPALAISIEKVPTGDRWLHEIKFDGYRVQDHLVNDQGFLTARQRWTKRFRKIADDAWHISAGSAIMDGEVVVPSESGTTDFSVLQNELKGNSTEIVLVAFDLLYLNGYDLRRLPLIERKPHLKKIIDGTDIQY